MASFGLAVLEEVAVFQAEFPSAEQASSVVVALLALVQVLVAGAVSNWTFSV
jgi:hypothetical protein